VEVCDRIVALNKGEIVKDIQTSTETLQELEMFRGLNFHIKKNVFLPVIILKVFLKFNDKTVAFENQYI
jgi:hypothetical protein